MRHRVSTGPGARRSSCSKTTCSDATRRSELAVHTASTWPSSRVGRPRGDWRPGPSARGRAPLYRAALGKQCGCQHHRAQAGGAARSVRQPARARPDRSEPGRPRQHPAALVLPPARAQGQGGREAARLDRGGRGWAGWVGHSFNATARCSSSPMRAGCAPRSSYRFGSRTSTTTVSSCASKGRDARLVICRSARSRWRRSGSIWSEAVMGLPPQAHRLRAWERRKRCS